MIWISLQDEDRMPWEREKLMVSVTKEQSSFAHFFKNKGGTPWELSVEFDLMRDKSGMISELEAGLNAEGFKRRGGRRTGVSVGPKMKDLLRASTFMLRLVETKTSERMLFHS